VHELYEDPRVVTEVTTRFGEGVAPGGLIDRSRLAELAFATGEGRGWLEGLIWPLVGERMSRWRTGLESLDPAPRAAVVEVPLLFESGMERVFDSTISVLADESVRHQRAAARGHRAVNERAARQLSQEEKAARSTYVVANDGDVAALEAKLSRVLDKIEAGE